MIKFDYNLRGAKGWPAGGWKVEKFDWMNYEWNKLEISIKASVIDISCFTQVQITSTSSITPLLLLQDLVSVSFHFFNEINSSEAEHLIISHVPSTPLSLLLFTTYYPRRSSHTCSRLFPVYSWHWLFNLLKDLFLQNSTWNLDKINTIIRLHFSFKSSNGKKDESIASVCSKINCNLFT